MRADKKIWNKLLLAIELAILTIPSIGLGAPSVESGPFMVAAVQFNPELNERDKNIEALLREVTKAAEKGARLIVTPENATTGYHYRDRMAIEKYVDTIPGTTTRRFEEVARKFNTHIVIGMPEVDDKTGIYYTSAALVGPSGYIGKYRKIHQTREEQYWSAWGDIGFPVFDTEIGKIAISICKDSDFFESARIAALEDADILAFLTNSSGLAIVNLQARAVQNGLYIVSANRSNRERTFIPGADDFHMAGASAIWSPEGEKLRELKVSSGLGGGISGTRIAYALVDPTNYDNPNKRRLLERRVELYQELMLHISPRDAFKTKSSHHVTAAALQYEPVKGEKEANGTIIRRLIEEAVKEVREEGGELNLIVLPELSTTGIIEDPGLAGLLAEDNSGECLVLFRDIAVSYGLYLIFGMIERDGDALYNSALLMDPAGIIVGRYRKTHLSRSDRSWATPGDRIEVFQTELGRIGIMIGYDVAFPEVAGVLAVNRADIIAIPSSWRGEVGKEMDIHPKLSENRYPSGSMCLWDAVARGSQAYTIISNFVGDSFRGRSAMYTIDPIYGLDKPVVASGDREQPLVVDFYTIRSGNWWNQEKMIATRRTHFYKPLVVPHH